MHRVPTACLAIAVALGLASPGFGGILSIYTVASSAMMPTLGESDVVVGSLYDPWPARLQGFPDQF